MPAADHGSAPPGPIAMASPPVVTTARAQPSPPAPAVPVLPAALPREPWVLGVATMLDLDRTLGAPMGHVAFIWFIPVSARVSVRAQGMWPLMGSVLGPNATDVRIWTFGAAVGMQYAFARAQARWRPFAGLAAGSQVLLTDTSGAVAEADKPHAPFVPSADLRAYTGVRVAILPRVQLLVEIEATRDWLLHGPARPTIATVSPTRWRSTRRWARCSSTEDPARILSASRDECRRARRVVISRITRILSKFPTRADTR